MPPRQLIVFLLHPRSTVMAREHRRLPPRLTTNNTGRAPKIIDANNSSSNNCHTNRHTNRHTNHHSRGTNKTWTTLIHLPLYLRHTATLSPLGMVPMPRMTIVYPSISPATTRMPRTTIAYPSICPVTTLVPRTTTGQRGTIPPGCRRHPRRLPAQQKD